MCYGEAPEESARGRGGLNEGIGRASEVIPDGEREGGGEELVTAIDGLIDAGVHVYGSIAAADDLEGSGPTPTRAFVSAAEAADVQVRIGHHGCEVQA